MAASTPALPPPPPARKLSSVVPAPPPLPAPLSQPSKVGQLNSVVPPPPPVRCPPAPLLGPSKCARDILQRFVQAAGAGVPLECEFKEVSASVRRNTFYAACWLRSIRIGDFTLNMEDRGICTGHVTLLEQDGVVREDKELHTGPIIHDLHDYYQHHMHGMVFKLQGQPSDMDGTSPEYRCFDINVNSAMHKHLRTMISRATQGAKMRCRPTFHVSLDTRHRRCSTFDTCPWW